MAKGRDCRRDLCVDKGARFNDNVSHNFWVLDVLFSFRKPTRSTFSIRVSKYLFSTGVLLHILFVWQVDHAQAYSASFVHVFCFCKYPSFCPTVMKKNQRVAREPGLFKRSPQQRAPGSPWPVPRLLSPMTVPEETKEIPHRSSWFIHFSFFVYYPSTSFLFQSLPACWLCIACPLPCMRLEPEKRNEKVRCSAGMHVRGQASMLLVVAAWSHNRGQPPTTPLGHDHRLFDLVWESWLWKAMIFCSISVCCQDT